jgi:cell wall-associated NlpC family hydrolase
VSAAWRWAAAIIVLPTVAAVGIAIAATASGAAAPSPPVMNCPGPPVQAGKPADGITLTAAQLTDAQVIDSVTASMQLPQRAAIIAIATAMQESRLINLPGGTSDSLGLFQQRPSQGWGTTAQIMQPVYATTRFLDALTAVPDWQDLPLTVAAQDVQHSRHPDAYAQWEPLATALAGTFDGTATACLTDNSTSAVPATGTTRVPAGFQLPSGTSPLVATVISYALAQLGKPYIWGGTGPAGYDCSGLVMKAYQAAGISLPRTTFQQVDEGTPVYTTSQLEPGDLIFTPGSDGTNPGHVGMYIGNNLVIEAPKTGKPIMLTPLHGYWTANAVAIRHITG